MKNMLKCLVAAFALTGALSVASVYTSTASADAEPSAPATPTTGTGVAIGDVPGNYLVVNHPIGAGKGAPVSVELDVTFTRSADAFAIGVLPTNNKEDIAQSKIVGNGLPGGDYAFYWNNGTQFNWTGFKNNTYTQDDYASNVQEHIVGNVTLKLEIGAWGIYDIYLNVPSSNTEMAETVQRDEWLLMTSGHAVGIFQEYEISERNGVNDAGYVYFAMKNAVYNSLTITPNTKYSIVEEYSDDFSSVETFSENYVTNDAFDLGVAEGKIVAPHREMIDTGNLGTHYSSYDAITLHPIINTPLFTLEDMTMSVSKDGVPMTEGVEGLTFTPTEDGTYDITFSAMDGSVTATHQIVVLKVEQQASVNTKFDAELDAFDFEGVAVAEGKATMSENAYFGTVGGAKNFVQMVRIVSVEEGANDFSIYFGKLMNGVAYGITFQKGSTKIVVSDHSGNQTLDIGVDVFNCIAGDGLVVQVKKLGGDVEISLTYGDLPMETLNEPVAKFVANAPLIGQVGITSISGGITLDRYVFINLTGDIEIPDADVEQELPPPDTTDSSTGGHSVSSSNSSESKSGCGGVMNAGLVACLLPLAFMAFRKRKD